MINISSRLAEHLSKDDRLEGCVMLFHAEFEPLIRVNKLTFFPEYTDHGIDHIEGVMRTAEVPAWSLKRGSDKKPALLATMSTGPPRRSTQLVGLMKEDR